MNYLLDTNAAVALLRNKPARVRERYRLAEAAGDYLALSSVVLFELWYGVARSTRRQENAERLRVFLSGTVTVVAFDDADARAAGELRATLEAAGIPIGPYDLLIAAQALRSGATLATANTAEFARVPGLTWQDWSGGAH